MNVKTRQDARGRRAFLFFFAVIVSYFAASAARAQNAAAPPAEVLAVMPKGAISLRYEAVPFGTERKGFLHVYCIPTKRDPNSPMLPEGGDPKTPIKRDDVHVGMALESSSFFLDIWGAGSGGRAMTRLHNIRFIESGDVAKIEKRWLRPAKKTGPVLLMDFGATHWHAWYVVTFPDGFNGKKRFMQRFLWGGEGEVYTVQEFTKTDKRGYLRIDQTTQESEAEGPKRSVYNWDGERFTDPQERWFVIVATSKTKAEAEAFARKRDPYGETEMVRSNRFPLLKPGLWVTVAERCRTKQEAEMSAEGMGKRPEFSGAYAKKAF